MNIFILTTPSPCIKHCQVANDNQTQSQHINNAFNNTHVQTSCSLICASDIIFNLALRYSKTKMSHPYIQITKTRIAVLIRNITKAGWNMFQSSMFISTISLLEVHHRVCSSVQFYINAWLNRSRQLSCNVKILMGNSTLWHDRIQKNCS